MAYTYSGQVTFSGLPVPGAKVTLTQGNTRRSTVTDEEGRYHLFDLPDGSGMLEVIMTGFSIIRQQVTIVQDGVPAKLELTLLPWGQAKALAVPLPAGPQQDTEPPIFLPSESNAAQARDPSDGLLINGSVNNGAASPFSQSDAFGNNRASGSGMYTGAVSLVVDNSALDAKPYSLTGEESPKSTYDNLTGSVSLGGPLKVPHLVRNGGQFFIGYEWTRSHSAAVQPGLVPTLGERNGIFPAPITDPMTGAPFPGNMIPQSRMSPQAQSLLALYPLPNLVTGRQYNYQVPLVMSTHRDVVRGIFDRRFGRPSDVHAELTTQSARRNAPNPLGYSDSTDTFGLDANLKWSLRLSNGVLLNFGYRFNRLSSSVAPYFANRLNISGLAGIAGNNQAPVNWGPPAVTFAEGLTSLTDALPDSSHNNTGEVSSSARLRHRDHNVIFGGDFRRLQRNELSQQNPRGSLTFTGATTGDDLADFVLGIPDTSSIAFGNADKYFRESAYDAYIADDWHISSGFTLNGGVRWEYDPPITELYNRLVNLAVAPGYSSTAQVLAGNPIDPLNGQRLPHSLLYADKSGVEPRIGIAWRPLGGASLLMRAGYGVYYNTSVYQSITQQLAQQPPLSKSFSVQNNLRDPLTLAHAFSPSPASITNTFAVDPNFRIGYAQNWQASVQTDLPWALQLVAEYLGIKGTRGLQEFLPNTVPIGAVNACPGCPAGFVYLASNGNSTRESGDVQLRRRLHSGLTATVQYTFSKSIDNASSLGGQEIPGYSLAVENAAVAGVPASTGLSGIAQDWRNLSGERGLSAFDQRHLLSFQMQYTTGVGLSRATLFDGWRRSLVKNWTIRTMVTAGSGLPLTPVYLAAVPGTGLTGSIRPDYTGAKLYDAPTGLSLNPDALTAPIAGRWGNAGRNSITGPGQFSLNLSLGRTFRLRDGLRLDLRVDSVNPLNQVTFTSWNTTINSAQFGLPSSANAMRSMETVLRLWF